MTLGAALSGAGADRPAAIAPGDGVRANGVALNGSDRAGAAPGLAPELTLRAIVLPDGRRWGVGAR